MGFQGVLGEAQNPSEIRRGDLQGQGNINPELAWRDATERRFALLYAKNLLAYALFAQLVGLILVFFIEELVCAHNPPSLGEGRQVLDILGGSENHLYC